MVTYTLNIDELSINDYTLIGVQTVLDEYKLAYLLNKFLGTKFSKAVYNLDFTEKNNTFFYPVYEYKDTVLGYDWFLIANSYKAIDKIGVTTIFDKKNEVKYLLPEKQKIDYFLKIESGLDINYIIEIIKKINEIPQIITSYEVKVESLKSKDFLIF
ncbi:IPExxxVDY family protein [Tenacibaculum dicentrarchi]|uniref:IPExxxVDY family protein n=1 Tax=Tenacibaculum dicentrarchi TaxID=669041 RepID=A0ABM9P1B5_9FLAO|nr:IPExxxVDY family protein [Tenacibaculum dicentrarchi]MCD8406814.1 IPExxxVDY family protein [Tenacibaculum dicentrarchi]MCD8414204.1 IPExxxVDY family protein [Tenacibaculum dicentrarchi]MCD8419158.1 IPExxxVDY family protein [Tenacibaculum dicentrarchi]MCD8424170.1 IPExxxVDY family protein [Tenacibaculum dicentrarchi]